jgi:C-type mannose receptor
MLSWGLDRAFKKRLPAYSSQGLLAVRCFADPACRVDYLRWLRRIDTEARRLDLVKGAEVLSAVLAPHIKADSKRPYDRKKMHKARKHLVEFLQKRSDDIAEFTSCLSESDREIDSDGDGFGCMDCNDADPAQHPDAEELCDKIDNDCSGLVDDAAACGCPSLEVTGSVFLACDLPMSWWDARKHCESLGANLARLDDPRQARALYEKLREIRDERWWVGADDFESEGSFRWRDGSPVHKELWHRGEPDNDGCAQNCAALKDDSKGRLQDTHCSQWRSFVCRAQAASSPASPPPSPKP